MRPEDYRYTENHEWVKVDGNMATVGITDFAVTELTDLTWIEMPELGLEVKRGEAMGEIESVKTVAELYAPLSGKIIEINSLLQEEENLVLFQESPFEKAWIAKIELANSAEADELLSREDYDKIAQ